MLLVSDCLGDSYGPLCYWSLAFGIIDRIWKTFLWAYVHVSFFDECRPRKLKMLTIHSSPHISWALVVTSMGVTDRSKMCIMAPEEHKLW